jgi:alkylation response protein AidB-like acyl-CoA dehydrogenase
VINGYKTWTSRAHDSDLMLVLARTAPPEEVEEESDGHAARMHRELRPNMQASVGQIGARGYASETGCVVPEFKIASSAAK